MSAPAAHSASLPIEFETVAALGIDVTLLLANLELTPAERLQRFQAMLSLHEQIQRRTLSEALLERRDHLDLAEKVRIWGPIEVPV